MPWKELNVAFGSLTLIDFERYATVLDAVERSLNSSQAAHGKAVLLSPFGWGTPVVENSQVVRVERHPIAPVRSDDSSATLVAVLQRLVWNRAALWAGPPLAEDFAVFYILDAMASKLVKRRLKPTVQIAADLAKFAIYPSNNPHLSGHDEFLFPILKILERSFGSHVPRDLTDPLTLLAAAIQKASGELRQRQKEFKQRQSVKRFDQALDRVEKLLASAT